MLGLSHTSGERGIRKCSANALQTAGDGLACITRRKPHLIFSWPFQHRLECKTIQKIHLKDNRNTQQVTGWGCYSLQRCSYTLQVVQCAPADLWV